MEQVDKSLGDFWVGIGSPLVTNTAGRPIPSDAQLMLEFLTNDIVYTCVNWNAAAVARVPLRLYAIDHPTAAPSRQADERTAARLKSHPHLGNRLRQASTIIEILDHPLLDLLERDNDGLGGYQLRYMTGVYMEVFGGAYWLLEDDWRGTPTQIKVLPTQRVMPLRNDDLGVVGYKYFPALTGNWISLNKADVLDFRFPAVEDPYGGRHAPLRSAFMQAELAAKYALYENSLMDNRARIDGTFIPRDQITRKEAERAELLWNEKFSRSGNGRVLVAEQAGTFVPARYPPTDLGPMEISRETLRRLALAFGVPEALLSKDATYANMQASETLYARQTILPRVLILEQKLNEMLTPRFGRHLFLAADNPVPADEAFNLQKAQLAINAGVLTRGEIRQLAGYNAHLPTSASQTPEAITDPGSNPAPLDDLTAQQELALLLQINRAVTDGTMEQAIAINTAARLLKVDQETARRLVSHPQGRRSAGSETQTNQAT
jgi:HK97 family phage portal protein